MEVSAGDVGAPPLQSKEAFQFTLTSQGRLQTPEEFAAIVLRTDPDGSLLRLGDVARVDLGSESYGNVARINGKQAALLGINQLAGANSAESGQRRSRPRWTSFQSISPKASTIQ